MSAPENRRYADVAITLHWFTAALLLLVLFSGWAMDNQQETQRSETLSYHVVGGALVFGLLVLRVSWRVANPPPELPKTLTRLHRLAINGVHVAIYSLMLVVPATGLFAGLSHPTPTVLFGSIKLQSALPILADQHFDLKREVHALAVYFLLVLIAGHIAASLIHQFWFKDSLVQRILPGRKQ